MSLGLSWLAPVLAAPAPSATMDDVCSAIMGVDPAADRSDGDKATTAHHHNVCPVCAAAVGAPPSVAAALPAGDTVFAVPQGRFDLSLRLTGTRQQARAPPLFAI
jgi:hypothetical protein